MKFFAYGLTTLIAIGIVVALAVTPATTPTSDQATRSISETELVSLTEKAGSVTLEVPSMHCQFSCYPKVKDSLEKNDLVTNVALIEQPDPNALSVKKVVVSYQAGFDLAGAMAKLDQAGFVVTDVVR